MPQSSQNNFFGMFNLPDITEEEARRAQLEQDNAQFQALIAQQAQNLAPGERGIFSAFAQLGRAVTGGNRGRLTPQQQKQYALQRSANKRIEELKASPGFNVLDAREQAFRTQEALAAAAEETGDWKTGTQARVAVADARTKYEKQRLEIENAQRTRERGVKQDALLDARLATVNTGEVGLFRVFPEGKIDYNNGGKVVSGYVNKATGQVVDPQTGRSFDIFMDDNKYRQAATSMTTAKEVKSRQEERLRIERERLAIAQRRERSGDKPTDPAAEAAKIEADAWKAASGMYDKPSLRAKRSTGVAMAGLASDVKAIAKSVLELDASGGATAESMLGPAGSVSSFVNSAANTVVGLANAALPKNERTDQPVVTSTGTFGGEERITGWAGVRDVIDEYIKVPPAIRESAQKSDEYKGMITKLIYATATMNESGGRPNLSDNDIKNAAAEWAARGSDPKSLLTALQRNFQGRAKAALREIEVDAGVFREFGYPEDKGIGRLYGSDLRKTIQESMQQVTDVISEAPNDIRPDSVAPALQTEAPSEYITLPNGRKVRVK